MLGFDVCVCVVVGCEGYYVLYVQCVALADPYKTDYLLHGGDTLDTLLHARVLVHLYRGGPVFAIGRFCMVRTNQTDDIDTQFAYAGGRLSPRHHYAHGGLCEGGGSVLQQPSCYPQ